ncbi:CynX/NimT family MFS transporter [Macrococcus capreoli]|uniref:CynX/NimT family MFS transporter n=1 Tax=Macrococcus capreoli TaxID=2982690 RepID=UPI0021D577D4|nr:MFS transporter [Macrococcus sp. TMW 2.2395]MCU7557738.1 MFS transporter [Macrococcus sp. TMW 2.2395]
MSKKFQLYILLLGVIVVASTLRAPLTAIGPMITEIGQALNIPKSMLGMLTTIPLIMFGIISPFVARLSRRLGMSVALMLGMIILLLGLVIRIIPNVSMLLVGTICIGIGIAIGNVILPSFVKWRFPMQMGLMTGVFTATMNLTAGIGGGASVPLSKINNGGYQYSLGFWIIFSIAGILLWMPQLRYNPKLQITEARRPIYRSKLAIAIALMMGFQSMTFYSTVTWFPDILMSYGIKQEAAGYYLMLNQFAQLPMTFIMPIVAMKMKSQRPLVFLFTGLYLIGFTAFLLNHTLSIIVAMIATGLAGGAAFSLCMLFFSLRAKTTQDAIELSGFSQSVGYFVAAIGPILMGYLHGVFNSHLPSFILFFMMTMTMSIFAFISSKHQYIFD